MNRNLLEKGFIPQEICTHIPNGFEDVEEISSSLHKILANNQISNVVNEIDQEKDISSLSNLNQLTNLNLSLNKINIFTY